ncbi:MAG: energy transducer TonB [Pseudomonas sp.]
MHAATPAPIPLAERSTYWAHPANRLCVTLFLAALAHLALLLGVSVTLDKPRPTSKSLDITLTTYARAEKPADPDFIAEDNQSGSGTLEDKALPARTEQTQPQPQPQQAISKPITATQPKPKPKSKPAPVTRPPAPEVALATPTAKPTPEPQPTPAPKPKAKPQPAPTPTPAPKPKPKPKRPQAVPAPTFDRSQLSAEIASLEADLSLDQQLYAKRTKVHRLTAASTLRDKGAWYKEAWRKKVERIGNLNYPDAARREGIHGSLRLLVSINRDGSLFEVLVLESSGQPLLDQAALRIVRLAAPFAALTGDLAEFDRLEIIRTWRFERGDRLSSQ